MQLEFLYIPHGSDERHLLVCLLHITLYLYIPHGSDESLYKVFNATLRIVFISHMVQMKEGKGCLKLPTMKYFISHMVQMKGGSPKATNALI